MLYCSPTLHCLGIPLLNLLATLLSFSVLLINADLFKFLTNFLLFLNGALSCLHVKFQRSLCPKDVARKCLIDASYLAEMQQNYEVKNTWGLERAHMWDMSQDKSKLFERYLLEGEVKIMPTAEITANKTQDLRENRKLMKLFWYCQHGKYILKFKWVI